MHDNDFSMIDDAECQECGEWFEYEIINPKYPRIVCPSCVKKWRKKYVEK